jgi:glycosyltransferase involved in cell wall biosynthesis
MARKICLLIRRRNRSNNSFERLYSNLVYQYNQQFDDAELILIETSVLNLIWLFFNQFKFDVFHFTGGNTWFMVFYFWPRRLLTIHDCYRLRFWHSRVTNRHYSKFLFYKLLYFKIPIKLAEKVSCPSAFTMSELNLIFPNLTREKLVHLPNIVTVDSIGSEGNVLNLSGFKVLLLGSSHNKNVYITLNALSQVIGNISILKTGYFNHFERDFCDRNSLNYTELGFVSDEDLLDVFRSIDVVLFTSTYEGFGLPIIEGQILGKMVITSNFPPCSDVLGLESYLVNPFDSESIKSALILVMGLDSSERNRVKEFYLRNAEKYSFKYLSKDYQEFYK